MKLKSMDCLMCAGILWSGRLALTAFLTLRRWKESYPLMNTWTERQLFSTISLWWQPNLVSIPHQ